MATEEPPYSPASEDTAMDDDLDLSIESSDSAEPSSEGGFTEQRDEPASSSLSPPGHFYKPFPLMSLPTELRLNIYRMALCRHKPLLLHVERKEDPLRDEALDEDSSSGSTTSEGDRSESSSQRRRRRRRHRRQRSRVTMRLPPRTELKEGLNTEPIVPNLLLASKTVLREARPTLYSDNTFVLKLDSALYSLSSLHQRSRSLIKHVRLTVPTHHDILEGFAELVRLGLRYCWGLRTFTIVLPYMFPDDGGISGSTNVYANAFHILRWLPQTCTVRLEGHAHKDIKKVVEENTKLAVELDEQAYQRRQHQMSDLQSQPPAW
ncbi:hypothetical protein BDY21DRAFT_168185 [Lineolata rhizophorae]|uniref:DUF7730 domain-containing protein n=1 Tax=Lineolata rhizophorae TaxID=578093 RepID=A0A6A6P9I0_9PEZI|nr:hypothetical protein BDY21DRAFT_168185 [Lineolata rhizophorae]